MVKLFLKHPSSIGETYFQHMKYALKISYRLAKISVMICIHAFLPFYFETKGGELICELNKELAGRKGGKNE